MDFVENSRVRFYRSSTRLLHGVFDHAPKDDPDILELVRGKTAESLAACKHYWCSSRVYCWLTTEIYKDKPALFDAFDTVEACLDIAAFGRRSPHQRRHHATRKRLPDATVDEHLILKGIPNGLHHMVGSLVGLATENNTT